MLHVFFVLASLIAPAPRLDERVEYWKRILHLDQWRIAVQVVKRQELEDGTEADIETDVRSRTAVIRVLREEDSDLPKRLARADQQVTIAHEMVHLSKLVRLGESFWQDESATNAETDALLRQHHCWRELLVVER
ncbi:MAG TPA: hypothetical protein VFA28_20410 [Bryobacteraceae bacterium]|jgi:hypothetical protein|nr:hypothetical protein [Bryobacteraceae bacterium]